MTGIIIGRFQVPYLHVGHLHLIATALRECDRVIILLGTSLKKRDERNPYTIVEREVMIQKIFPQVDVFTLFDNESDEFWSDMVDGFSDVDTKVALYHSRDSFKDHYTGKLPLREVEEIPGVSGTKLREEKK